MGCWVDDILFCRSPFMISLISVYFSLDAGEKYNVVTYL